MRDDDVITEGEHRLSRVLRPENERVRHVITRALAPGPRTRPIGGARLLAAALMALLVLGMVIWRASAPRPASLTISGSGSVIVVTSDDGRRWILDGRNESETRGQFAIAVPQ